MELAEHAAAALDLGVSELLRQRLVKLVPIAAPAAGAEWSCSVPAGSAWDLLAVRYQLATSAVVANRNAVLDFRDDAGTSWCRNPPAAVQAASLTRIYQRIVGLGSPSVVADDVAPLATPPPVLLSGWQVRSVTAGLDVGDAYTAIVLVVREWSLLAVAQAAAWYERKQWPT